MGPGELMMFFSLESLFISKCVRRCRRRRRKTSSSLKSLGQIEPNLLQMFIGMRT